MNTSLIAGTITNFANNDLAFANFANRLDFVSNLPIAGTDSIANQIPLTIAAGSLQAALSSVATPPLKSISRRSPSPTFLRQKRRLYGGGDGGGGSGGGGWNFDGFGGSDWDESSSSSSSTNPAYHFHFNAVFRIAVKNFVHFAWKMVVRFAGDVVDGLASLPMILMVYCLSGLLLMTVVISCVVLVSMSIQ